MVYILIVLMFIVWLYLLYRATEPINDGSDAERWAQEILDHIRDRESPNQ